MRDLIKSFWKIPVNFAYQVIFIILEFFYEEITDLNVVNEY